MNTDVTCTKMEQPHMLFRVHTQRYIDLSTSHLYVDSIIAIAAGSDTDIGAYIMPK